MIYKEMVEVMDEGIGKVMSTLKDLKLDRNTFVFFCSDNGGIKKVGDNGVLRGYKASLWEGGHRVPAIAWYPEKIAPKQVNHEIILTMDLYPTIMDIIGAEKPQNIDGLSVKTNLFNGKPLSGREVFWGYGGRKAMRKDKWKLLLPNRDVEPLLFNLEKDLGEDNNLAKKFPERVENMLMELELWENDIHQSIQK